MTRRNVFEVVNPKFPVGTRVFRPVDVTDPESPVLHGEVEATYRLPGAGWNEVYLVRWDNGQVQEGLLPGGLQRESE